MRPVRQPHTYRSRDMSLLLPCLNLFTPIYTRYMYQNIPVYFFLLGVAQSCISCCYIQDKFGLRILKIPYTVCKCENPENSKYYLDSTQFQHISSSNRALYTSLKKRKVRFHTSWKRSSLWFLKLKQLQVMIALFLNS